MASILKDIILNAGETIVQDFVTTLASSTAGYAGKKARLAIRESALAALPILTATSTNYLVISSTGAYRKVRLTYPASLSTLLVPGVCLYQLEHEDSAGVVTRTHEGKATISAELAL